MKLGSEGPWSPSSPIIEQILRKSISEGLNHVTILSEVDNLSSRCFSCFDEDLSEFGGEGGIDSNRLGAILGPSARLRFRAGVRRAR